MDKDRLKILLIEDDESDYVLIRDLLSAIKHIKFYLDWVTTYEAALEKLVLNQHDVGLVDYQLGEWNGIDLIREAIQQNSVDFNQRTG
jgi:DNA-binding response OmpR family regulator